MRIYGKWFESHELIDAWQKGNDRGDGYAIGELNNTPQEAVEAENITHIADLDPEGNVVATDHGNIIVVVDHNGPWAVDVTEILQD